jgi:hypothetical protein
MPLTELQADQQNQLVLVECTVTFKLKSPEYIEHARISDPRQARGATARTPNAVVEKCGSLTNIDDTDGRIAFCA